jgi:hypothetical protein
MQVLRRVLRAFRAPFGVAVLMTPLLLGCAQDEVTAPGAPQHLVGSLGGTYSVRSVNGRVLPLRVCAGETKLIAGTLRLRSDRTFVGTIRHSSPPGAPRETYQETGTYSRRSGTSTIVFESVSRRGVTWTGTILSDGSLRVRYPVCGEVYTVRLVRI